MVMAQSKKQKEKIVGLKKERQYLRAQLKDFNDMKHENAGMLVKMEKLMSEVRKLTQEKKEMNKKFNKELHSHK